jgi:hypothetical protein
MGTTLATYRINSAKNFNKSFDATSNDKTYAFFGKTLPFDNETDIPVYSDNNIFSNETWRTMISFKKIISSDAILGIRNVLWTNNTIYEQYDDADSNLSTKDFYVMTSAYNVYKCLNNNDRSPSTITPTSTTTDRVTLADGYTWKYMYTLDAVLVTKFLNDDLIPVKFLEMDDGSNQWDVQINAIPGTLDRVDIEKNEGTFTSTPVVNITGDGTGATAVAQLNGNVLEKIVVTSLGSGYSYINVVIPGREDDIELRGILSPANGHGSNASEELFGFNSIINFDFEGDEGGTIMTGNDYRSIGILRNPFAYGTTNVIDVDSGNQTTKLTCTTPAVFDLDETVVGGTSGAKGVVVWQDGNDVNVNNLEGEFTPGETITGQDSILNNTINTITDAELERFTGEFLYSGFRVPVEHDNTSTEIYKLNIFM